MSKDNFLVMRVLMVCLGNICRSPLAEGIFRRELERAGLPWLVDSAGTSDWHAGELPDPRSIQVARQHDLDITDQRARPITRKDLAQFDYIFAMDSRNQQFLLDLADGAPVKARIHRFLEFAGHQGTLDVPDPYWDDRGFQQVFDLLAAASPEVIVRIQESTPAYSPAFALVRDRV